jgi:predicted O-linked N-acetylglucosamine transferase (SPINDLY family)
LQPPSELAQANIRREFGRRRVSAEKIVYAPFVSQTDNISRLQLADVALDTFPYNSHTTGSDALWAGVPMVTLKGQTFASRVAASLLETHGFPELITQNQEDYLKIARDIAIDVQRRTGLKKKLQLARLTSPLFDTLRFTRDLEKLYRAMVDDHSKPADQRPHAVTITKAG